MTPDSRQLSLGTNPARKLGTAAFGLLIAAGLAGALILRAQNPDPSKAKPAFEVASVKPSNPAVASGGNAPPAPGVPPAPAAGAPPAPAAPPPGGSGLPGLPTFRVDHKKLTVTNYTLFDLMLRAHGIKGCTGPGESTCALISGGPSWIRSAKFDIAAKIPDSSPDYTTIQFFRGEAPELRLMLQALLEDRFNLKLHREMKQLPVYVLTAGKNGTKLKESTGTDNSPPLWGMTGKPNGEAAVWLKGEKTSMAQFADSLASITGRPVLDQTGLKGNFDFAMEYASDPNAPGATPFAGPEMFTAFQEQLGLKLDTARAPIEILVIDRVEKPSAN